ncbi:NAD(P)H-dependent glycerol-3-phosphate dehydrogenase [Paracoccus sp. MC1862]|uniref:NAD(P)H-dependent glycerol-3-phosphate dehydrogenase n=1 Tax=Paracoccus sp. MC1862 TaxID=2760307 RepID=UPI0016013B29|nr:NAD(P)H-dependent glycerol-3-phosphate dehydrogenase [Paracoccus sp. MC1862]MBB1497423.1 NAD(P)-dependent glycerol-3-phosphate dehydrogenase [Paracoccus sp. MC1862]QQO45909.1 NAD(P)-dependent glycerol-3-phosphate dehydrogenase [Paracoccus sp. MC1862]
MSVAVLGAGAFGTALAVALSANGPVALWGRRIGWRGENPLLPGVILPGGVTATESLPDADILLVAIPAQATGAFLSDHAARLDGRALVSCAKGIDLATGRSPARMLAEACPAATVAVLTGPSFAADIARGLPTALTLACADAMAGHGLQHALSTPVLRLYRTTDVTGAELGGALKNVIAIAAGVAIGAGLGDSARAAIITRGFAEMTRFAAAKGADPETLTGLSGLGDLILTATSEQSRNFRYGLSLGRAEPFDPHVTVEGAATARAVAAIAARDGIEMPISTLIAGLAGGRVGVKQAVELLLARPLKEE